MGFVRSLIVTGDGISIAIFMVALIMLTIKMLEIDVLNKGKITIVTMVEKRLRKDKAESNKNEQMDRIGIERNKTNAQYRTLIQNVIISLKLTGVTVENFTSGFIFIGVLAFVGFTMFFENMFLGLLVSIPTIMAIIATVLSITRTSVRANDNRVMDSTDLICPTIEHSVTSAIRKNLDGFDPKIKKHYVDFLDDIDSRGLLMPDAMKELNKKLGPRFDDFAQKSVIFQNSGEEGMAEMFMDVVEMNSSIRSINMRADAIFRDINFNMVGSAGISVAFLGYMYVNPLTSEFMVTAFLGKLVSAICITILIIMYAISQISQVNIDYNRMKES